MQYIEIIPFWAWMLIPAAIIGLLGWAFTRKLTKGIHYAFIVFLLTWITVGFYHWEQYLTSHFVGRIDANGRETILYRQGWHLMIDAWQFWLIPTIGAIGLTIAAIVVFARGRIEYGYGKNHSKAKPKSAKQVSQELDTQQLQQQIAFLKAKLKEEGKTIKADTGATDLKIQQLTDALQKSTQLNEELNSRVKKMTQDLDRAKALIKKLIEEHANLSQQKEPSDNKAGETPPEK